METSEQASNVSIAREKLTEICVDLEAKGLILNSVRFVREDGKTRVLMNYAEI